MTCAINKTTQKAIEAKAAGFDYIVSIVCQHKSTTYYHIEPVDKIITCKYWPGVGRSKGSRNGLTMNAIKRDYPGARIITRQNMLAGKIA